MNDQQEREAFEVWAKNRAHPFHDREPLLNGAIDRYSDIAWQAWQARAALAANEKQPSRATDIATALALPGCERLKEWAEIGPVQMAQIEEFAYALAAKPCTCPSGDGSLRWPCPAHPAQAQQADTTAILSAKVAHWRLRAEAAERALAQQAKPEAQQPLTDEQIEGGRSKLFSVGNPYCPITEKAMRTAVRWAERCHGIGASGEASNG